MCLSFWGTSSLKYSASSAWRFLKCFSWSQVKTTEWDSEFRDLFLQWGESCSRRTESTSLITFLSGNGSRYTTYIANEKLKKKKSASSLINCQSNLYHSQGEHHVWSGFTIRLGDVLFYSMTPWGLTSPKHDRYHLRHCCSLLSLSVPERLDAQQWCHGVSFGDPNPAHRLGPHVGLTFNLPAPLQSAAHKEMAQVTAVT